MSDVDTLEFWVHRSNIPANEQPPPDGFDYVKCIIPKVCKQCTRELMIHSKGDFNSHSTFVNGYNCSHYSQYNLVWRNRLIEENKDGTNVENTPVLPSEVCKKVKCVKIVQKLILMDHGQTVYVQRVDC